MRTLCVLSDWDVLEDSFNPAASRAFATVSTAKVSVDRVISCKYSIRNGLCWSKSGRSCKGDNTDNIDDEGILVALSRHHGNVRDTQTVASTIQNSLSPFVVYPSMEIKVMTLGL